LKRGTPKHPKIFHLCTLLKCRRPTAIGYLEMLWHMTAEYTPQGNIGKYDDAWIEASLDWTGRKGFLVDCLAIAGWLDRDSEWRLLVHDWRDHADSAVIKRLQRLGLHFLESSKKMTGQSTVTDQKTAASRAPLPEPCLSMPEPEPLSAAVVSLPAKTSPPKRELRKNGKIPGNIAAIERELNLHETAKRMLLAYPGADALCGSPDDVVIGKCLQLCRGKPVSEEEAMHAALVEMAKGRKSPASSWMWFPTVMAQYLGDTKTHG
jgi:hypothetical protein